jgi:hypothetical protein
MNWLDEKILEDEYIEIPKESPFVRDGDKDYFNITVKLRRGRYYDFDIMGYRNVLEPDELVITHVDEHKDMIDEFRDDMQDAIYEATFEALKD